MNDRTEVVNYTTGLAQGAKDFKVTNLAGVRTGVAFLVEIKKAKAKIDEVLGPVKINAYKTYKEAIKLYEQASSGLTDADEHIRTEINTHLDSLKNKPEDLPEGVSVQGRWKVKEVDIVTLCRAIGEGKLSPDLVEPNMTLLNKMATSMKDFMNVPGVVAEETKSVMIRVKE